MRLLILAYIFFIGSVAGWILEVFYRRFFSAANPERNWINPGACTGPYLPLYGCGLCIVYCLAQLETAVFANSTVWSKLVTFFVMAVCMTVIEYIAGICSLKIVKVRLWDYTGEWGNIQGVICPKFSLIWAVLCVFYYYLLHPFILRSVEWFTCHLAFSFVIGMFYGIFLIDVVQSAELVAKLKKYAEENRVIIRYEAIKTEIRRRHSETKKRYHFFRPFNTPFPMSEHLQNLKDSFEKIKIREKK